MYRGVMFDDTEDWWRKTDLSFLKIFVYRLKNSEFILESKMAELNWKHKLTLPPKRTYFFLRFGQENNILGESFERRAY